MNSPKTYINNIKIKEQQFANGHSMLKLSLHVDKVDALAAQLKAIASTGGWINLEIVKRKNPDVNPATGKVTATHSMCVDNWQPGSGTADPSRMGNRTSAANVPGNLLEQDEF